MLEDARELKARLGPSIKLIMNDRADLCLAADFDGSTSARTISLQLRPPHHRPTRLLGVSTTIRQLAEADKTTADYLAIGPIFATASKANPDPTVGVEGLRQARKLTSKPLVAIGASPAPTPVLSSRPEPTPWR